jgi:predicted ester cyclase
MIGRGEREEKVATEHEAMLRRYYDAVWNQGDLDVSADLISPDEIYHMHGVTGRGGPAWDRGGARTFRGAFPDIQFTIELVVDGGDLTAVLWRASGTHLATGTPIADYTGVNIFRIVDGAIVEVWNTRDDLSLYAQLGLVPPRSELGPRVFDKPPGA